MKNAGVPRHEIQSFAIDHYRLAHPATLSQGESEIGIENRLGRPHTNGSCDQGGSQIELAALGGDQSE